MREIVFYKDYFINFYFKQKPKVQEKIDFVVDLVRNLERIPSKFFEHIEGTDGIYEIRIEYQSNIHRIFCFFDKGNIVVLANCYTKKTRKGTT